ncbi:DUF4062 domain-containing protein [Lawsonibacter sp. LCP25S3_G6]|uniref:DUF4062 domain-containing protein n=1 Tax=unclassified Lawsonibacter TaxID=2617946 RepID=UPI003F9B551A
MDKRFQVFVSSTYEDLQEERREVMQALLELDCIPAGMELFPASNEDQWSLIKRVIDDSDYYIVIIGGRYGSTNDEGMSYTEMEYRYAIETNKPIIAFLHKNPGEIKSAFTEKTDEGKEKLEHFRELVQKKMVRYWSSPDELGSVVSRSMVKLIKQFPAVGWVRADSAIDEASMREILRLQKENDELKQKLQKSKMTAPAGTDKLSQGDDTIDITIRYKADTPQYSRYSIKNFVTVTWNDLFAIIAPYMVIECKESVIKDAIVEYAKGLLSDELSKELKEKRYSRFYDFSIENEEFQNIKIQYKALGLIMKSVRNRSVKDTLNYWTLTEYGDYVMTQLIAIKKSEEDEN